MDDLAGKYLARWPVYSVLILHFLAVTCLASAKFDIRPKASASWRVDGNYYRAEAVEREVYTCLVQPGIELGIETDRSVLLLDYTLDAWYYDDRDTVTYGHRASHEHDYVGHTGVFEAKHRPVDRLPIGLYASLCKTRDAAQSDRFSNDIARETYTVNQLTPMVCYEVAPIVIELRYRNTETDYDAATFEDSRENRGVFDLIYDFTATSSVDLECQRWERDYNMGTSDYTSYQAALIFRKRFNYFSFEGGVGYQDRSFDDPAVNDMDMVCYQIAVTGQNPPAPGILKSYVSVGAESNLNDQGIGNAYYEAHRFALTAGLTFFEKLPVSITGYYQKSDYVRTCRLSPASDRELREDDTYDISGRIDYIFSDSIALAVTAGYEHRDSNFAGYDYENNYYMVEIAFGYSLGK